MCERSGCGALVENVPVSDAARAVAQARGEDPQAYALAGGEEFELLAAIAPRSFPTLSARFERTFGLPLLAVGYFREGSGVMVRKGAQEQALPASGYDHLRES